MINMLMENWKEIFLNEKKQYDADMEKLEEELAALQQVQEEEESEQESSGRKADQAMAFLEEDMKDKLIEKVVVYPGNRIEIVWKFEGHFQKIKYGIGISGLYRRELLLVQTRFFI